MEWGCVSGCAGDAGACWWLTIEKEAIDVFELLE